MSDEDPGTPGPGAPAATYGTPPRTRTLGVAGGLLLAGLVAWLAWAGLHQEQTTVQSSVVGYAVVSDHAVQVRYLVARDPDRPVRCTLEAQDAYHEPVGRIDVSVPAGGPRQAERRDTVSTTRRAVTGIVVGCRYTD